ncbi:MAG: hypothetical protein L6R36_005914 [Xanthoria steineri]|nr:MAG: hypothetical protein L6R36_005914 [Xanthoria steineri]
MIYHIASVALLALTPVLAQDSTSVTATPTIPATVTSVQQVNSIFATASTAPDVGNPGNINDYPLCAQICNNETIAINFVDGDTTDVRVLCGPQFRALTAGCQAATCDADEQTQIDLLTTQFCGSLYNANATYSSQVSVAVASATALAIAATQGKDPNVVADFPACAQSCITQNNFNGCGGNIPLCVCQGIEFNAAVGPCQTGNCNPEDLFATLYLAETLCEPYGGILTNPINYTAAVANGTVTNSTNTTAGNPSPSPFTGEATQAHGRDGLALGLTGMAVIVALVML